MAVQVLKGNSPAYYGTFEQAGYDLAQFLSASPDFEIIDSYSSHWWSNYPTTPPVYSGRRYKGDPMLQPPPGDPAERGSLPVWSNVSDVGELGDWIVVECQSSIHAGLGVTLPKWQCKIAWNGGSYAYDVSDPGDTIYGGTSYWQRAIRSRFCPWGGWDLADSLPDFKPSGRPFPASGNNHGWALGHGGSSNDTRWYCVVDSGYLLTFSRRNQGAFDIMGLGCYIGDMRPTISGRMPNPRVHIASGDFSVKYMQGVENNDACAESSYGSGIPIEFPDHNEDWVSASSYRLPTGWFCMEGGRGQPNSHSASLEIDTFPFMPAPLTGDDKQRVWFDVPAIRKGRCVGNTLFGNKQRVSTGEGYGLILPWDGSTSLY